MTHARAMGTGFVCTALASCLLGATDFSTYRGLRFGMTPVAASKQAGTATSALTVVHQQPALIQELNWRPSAAPSSDPIQSGVLRFVDGKLSRIVITYDRRKIEGMAAEDMIDAISQTYGTATKPGGEVAFRSIYGESTAVVARWEDSGYSYDLVRTGDQSSFALILYSKTLDAQAQAAIVEAIRLEKEEAPQRELERQAKLAEAERIRLEKARLANQPNFRP
jgi:hypothetical protein